MASVIPVKIAVAACAVFAIPLLLAGPPLLPVALAWLGVVIVYLVLLRMFGMGFVIEGAVFTFVLSLVVSIAIDAVRTAKARRAIPAPTATAVVSPAPRPAHGE